MPKAPSSTTLSNLTALVEPIQKPFHWLFDSEMFQKFEQFQAIQFDQAPDWFDQN